MENTVKIKGERLASLDILRGLDLFLLVFFQPVFMSLCNALGCGWLEPVMYQFDHEVWEGFRFWDLIMPLFMFMAGASMPFSLSKYMNGGGKSVAWRRIGKRVVLLFLLGMVVQGHLLDFDLSAIRIYVNTLQAIAAGYLIASVLLLYLPLRWQIVATAALLVVYWIPMTFAGDFTLTGNFAYKVDEAILGRFRGDPSYTWVWSSINFGATVMLGAFAGRMMKNAGDKKERTALNMFFIGLSLAAAGWLWGLQIPVIKRIWTSSMVLVSGGYCFVLMSFFYYLIDCKGHGKYLGWLKIYGMNSILAYMIGECVNFRCVVHSVSYGLEHILGGYYQTWLTFGNFSIVFLILYFCYRRKIFLKV